MRSLCLVLLLYHAFNIISNEMSRSLTLISSSKYDEKLSTEVTINMNKKDKV